MIGTALEVVAGLVLMAVAFAGGYVTHWKTAIDYKARWKQALDLAERVGAKDMTGTDMEVIVAALPTVADPDERTRKKLRGLTPVQRANAEKDRLEAGLPPVDDLEGMGGINANWYAHMLRNRYTHGWDERGRKIPEQQEEAVNG